MGPSLTCSTRSQYCRRWILRVCAVLLAGACGDSTSPDTNVIRLSGDAAPTMSHGRYETGEWRVECPMDLSAELGSGSAATATWKGGSLTWADSYTGTSLGSEIYSETETAGIWGAPTVTASHKGTAALTVWAGVPFRVTAEFRYLVT